MSGPKRAKNEAHPGVTLIKRGDSLFAQWRELAEGGSIRKQVSLTKSYGFTTKIEALNWAKQLSKSLIEQKKTARLTGRRRSGIAMNTGKEGITEALEKYLSIREAKDSAREYSNEKSRFTLFRDWLNSGVGRRFRKCQELTLQALSSLWDFIDTRQARPKALDELKSKSYRKPISQASKDAYRRSYLRFFNWGKRSGFFSFSTSPDDLKAYFPPFKIESRKPIVLGPDKLNALIAAAMELDELQDSGRHIYKPVLPLLLLTMLTGMRKSEVLHLRWGDVHLDRGVIEVRASEGFKPKRGEEREIPLEDCPTLVSLLQSLHSERSDSIYVIAGDSPTAPRNLRQSSWKRLAERAGVPDANIKDLRSTFATCVGRGMPKMADRYLMAERMGHSVTTAERYYVGAKPLSAGETVEDCLGLTEPHVLDA
ncbi:MAG: tyrosine-type recombinase/integrase [Planctomycetes bacterium]|nr:tyrosine-type recombinase/integrase [Planctomycetota bacterium]